MRVRDVVLADDDLRVDAGVVDVAEHFDDVADRPACGGRPAANLDDHHVVRLGRQAASRRDVDVRPDAAVEGNDVGKTARVRFETADDGVLRALDDANDAPLETLRRLAFDAHRHTVAVHGFGEVGRGNVDVFP